MAQLFNQLSKNTIYSLIILPSIIDKVLPLKSKHRIDLPVAISDLSTILTVQRSELKHSYWSSARFASAYLRYFFPWNVIRLTRLLEGLNICEPYPDLQKKDTNPRFKPDMRDYKKNRAVANSEQILDMNIAANNFKSKRLLVDLGSGPLTLPIALWLAKPQWRNLPLSILCLDTSPQALDYGKQIFHALAGKDTPWRIVTKRTSLNNLYKELRSIDAIPWLLTGANVINELFIRTTERYEDNFSDLSAQIASFCSHKDTEALFVEPGTRLGGKNISLLREKTLEHNEHNLRAIAPCVHNAACPLQDSRSWCHFTFDVEGAPRWLSDLSHAAYLTKTALSLSFVLLKNSLEAGAKKTGEIQKHKPVDSAKIEEVRIVSSPFKIGILDGFVRYACSGQGLIIVKNAHEFTSGSIVKVLWSGAESVDKKTGVCIVEPYILADGQSDTKGTRSKKVQNSFAGDKDRNGQSEFAGTKDKREQNSINATKSRNVKDAAVSSKGKKEQSADEGNKEKTEPKSAARAKIQKKRIAGTKDRNEKKWFSRG